MKPLGAILALIALAGCTSPLEQFSIPQPSWNEIKLSIREGQRQREAADAQAKANGDDRPYPTGWPSGFLPRNPDPTIVDSIHPGQTMADVVKIMGAEGWSIEHTRYEFLSSSRASYRLRRSSRKEPADWRGFKRNLPIQGEFTEWRYQGFPMTSDWIVIFFASPQQDVEPRVIARGIFGLGCFL